MLSTKFSKKIQFHFFFTFLNRCAKCNFPIAIVIYHKALKDESLGPETKGTETCLVLDEKFWDSLVLVLSQN